MIDEDNRFSIQVTSDNSSEKIKHTIEEFIDNESYLKYDKLVVLILTNKKNYTTVFDTKGLFSFSNSTLSNYDPLLKKVRNKDIMKQSLKLQIMSGLIKDEESIRKWADDSDLDNNIAIMHGKEMMAIIDKELEQ